MEPNSEYIEQIIKDAEPKMGSDKFVNALYVTDKVKYLDAEMFYAIDDHFTVVTLNDNP